MLNFQFLLCIFYIIQKASTHASEPKVQLDNAQVIGQTIPFKHTKVHEYLGVPYAQPPVGDLRFKPSQPLPGYEGTISAQKQAPACPQYIVNSWNDPGTYQSEDCLFLNIWVPSGASSRNKKAVFYWIYGGEFKFGSIKIDAYNGTALAAVGDVIVVTVSYRLGVLGYLYSATEDAPGNAGLWDMALGLKWVNKYINAFGGDTSRITVAGESGGSVAAGLLRLSPVTNKLFRRLIMESGSPVMVIGSETPDSKNLELGNRMAPLVGCGNDTFNMINHPKEVTECLRVVDYEVIVYQSQKVLPNIPPYLLIRYGDELFPEDPRVAITSYQLDCKEVLIGVNQDEGTNLVSMWFSDVFGYFGEKDPKVNRSLAEYIITTIVTPSNPSMAQAAAEFYLPEDLPDEENIFRDQATDATGDFSVVCGVEEFARQCARNSKVYFYYWRHRPSTSPWAEWEGANHVSELEFVFGQPAMHPELYEPGEEELSYRVMRIWTDFTKYGSLGSWPKFSKRNQIAVNLALEKLPKFEEVPHLNNCKFVGKALGFQKCCHKKRN